MSRTRVHTREEPVAERKDQIAYDLNHHEQLRAAGVHVDPSALPRSWRSSPRCPTTRPSLSTTTRRDSMRYAAASSTQ